MEDLDFRQLSISAEEAEAFAWQHYGIRAKAKALAGEVDFNFRLDTIAGVSYTLKLSRPDAAVDEMEFQASIMQYLAKQHLPFQIPEAISSSNGAYIVLIKDKNGQHRYLRLQSWLEGRMLGDVHPRSEALLQDWGRCCGELSKALQDFGTFDKLRAGTFDKLRAGDLFAQRFYKWDPSQTLHSRVHLEDMTSEEEREIATYFWNLFEKETQSRLAALRKSVNYNDAHEHNVLVNEDKRNPRICGVIDFGDAVYTHTINELAIACAYAGMGLPDPLQAIAQVVQGYHAVFPLTEAEVEVLYAMISARLLITVASAAHNKKLEPDNAYLLISEAPAWTLLRKWRAISPALAHYTFRHACGWQACPSQSLFAQWLRHNQASFADVVQMEGQKQIPLDLSVGSLELGNNTNFLSIASFQRCINRMLADQEAQFGVGGYGEVRPFYTTDAYQVNGNQGAQWRSVHLGLDIWAKAQTPVFAPLDGEVHSIVNNVGERDYGPTLILKHQLNDDCYFYTLYGHLSIASLSHIEAGDTIRKGQQIAWIGPAPENGNWPPHLHFQVILDMLANDGDFPGVAFPHERDVWLSICPNPHLFFPQWVGAPSKTTATKNHILQARQKYLGPSLSISYQQPLHMVRGFGAYLYDTTARRYLDTVNNVAHVGHEHPRIVRAAQGQMALLNTNTRYLHDNIIHFAEDLLATLPPELAVVYFVNSGSEANELALRMAKVYTGQKDMLAIEVGYHGNTGACIDISSYKFDGKGGQGAPPHTHIIPLPDPFRGKYAKQEEAGKKYADHARLAIEKVQTEGRNIAGFIGESILSCGGQIVPPATYFQEVYRLVRAAGGLCIADEVQVGFGRVGESFWGFELHGVVPDIVTMGKPIGNGHPLAAVVTTRAVAEAFTNGMEFFNTFGGNPVSCAIGREVLQVVKEEKLQQQALEVGDYLKAGLSQLQKEYPIMADVRGHGFFLGIELIREMDQLIPAAAEATYLVNRMRERGILMSTDGPDHNVIKIKPPMCFNEVNADFLLENLELVLQEDFLR